MTGTEFMLISLMVLFMSIIVHEFGHSACFRQYNKEVKVMWGKMPNGKLGLYTGLPTQYLILTQEQRNNVYLVGIVLGSVPIMIAAAFNTAFFLILAGYCVGCQHDIEYLWRYRNG